MGPKKGIFGKVTRRIKNRTYRVIFFTGLIFAASTYFYVFSLEKAGTINGSIAIQTYPLFSIMFEYLFYRKKKSPRDLFFTFVVMVGIYYLGTLGTWKIAEFSVWFFVSLSVPILWGIAHVILKNMLDTSPITPNQVTSFRVFISFTCLGIISVVAGGWSQFSLHFTNTSFQLVALFMGAVYYLELVNWFYAIKHIEVSVASTITTPTPLIALLGAIIFLHEQVAAYQLVSLALVCLGLIGLILSGHAQSKKNSLRPNP